MLGHLAGAAIGIDGSHAIRRRGHAAVGVGAGAAAQGIGHGLARILDAAGDGFLRADTRQLRIGRTGCRLRLVGSDLRRVRRTLGVAGIGSRRRGSTRRRIGGCLCPVGRRRRPIRRALCTICRDTSCVGRRLRGLGRRLRRLGGLIDRVELADIDCIGRFHAGRDVGDLAACLPIMGGIVGAQVFVPAEAVTRQAIHALIDRADVLIQCGQRAANVTVLGHLADAAIGIDGSHTIRRRRHGAVGVGAGAAAQGIGHGLARILDPAGDGFLRADTRQLRAGRTGCRLGLVGGGLRGVRSTLGSGRRRPGVLRGALHLPQLTHVHGVLRAGSCSNIGDSIGSGGSAFLGRVRTFGLMPQQCIVEQHA